MSFAFGDMNTNAQTHADLIVSFQLNKTEAIILAAAVVVGVVVVVIVFAKKRTKT